jgi:hypothetical protein
MGTSLPPKFFQTRSVQDYSVKTESLFSMMQIIRRINFCQGLLFNDKIPNNLLKFQSKRRSFMKISGYVLLILSLIIPSVMVSAEDMVNPLIEEMRTLDVAFRDIVSAVAIGDGRRVNKSIDSLHGLRERTHKAVETGMIRLPRNQHRLKEFLKLDERFHTELELLSKAAHKNNQRKMLILTKKLLDGCVNCHRVFKR